MSAPKPATYNLHCHQGVDFDFTFSMKDGNNVDVNFAGASLWLTVYSNQRKSEEVVKLSSAGGAITQASGNLKVSAAMNGTLTDSLAAGVHSYDLDVEFTDLTRWRIFEGKFTVHEGSFA